ncbi:MAG: NUDIX domain-containing protein [Bacteroidales bacterium]|nr:NUDIX domain-containing protein [Bacteroidales bacterium]
MDRTFHPQNVLQYCPRCGCEQFEPYGVKASKCGTCGFVFYYNAATAVAAIIRDSQNRVLLTKRAFDPGKGTLDLPGGFVDPLESAETALCREIKEELELEIVSKDYKGSFPNTYVYGGVMYFTCDMVYECTVASYEHIAANDDVVAAQFYEITEQVIEQVGAESIRKILRRFCLSK